MAVCEYYVTGFLPDLIFFPLFLFFPWFVQFGAGGFGINIIQGGLAAGCFRPWFFFGFVFRDIHISTSEYLNG